MLGSSTTLTRVPYEPPSEPGWDFVVDEVLPRVGMWTGGGTYAQAYCFVIGFEAARGGRISPLLQNWVDDRYGKTNIGWPWVLVRLALGIPREELVGPGVANLSPDDDRAAREMLAQALRDLSAAV